MRRLPVFLAIALLSSAAAFALGYRKMKHATRPAAIRLEQGVPVGVLHTPSGAVAAADNDLAAEDQALTSADGLTRVVDTAWAPGARSVELAQPIEAAAIAGRPATFAGLRLTAAVAADRLESYTRATAQVGVWHEITVWSPAIEPTQRWLLDTVTLQWSSGHWMIASRSSAPDAQTPVPAWTSGTAPDRAASAFDARLSGMSSPYYEAAGS